MPHPPHGTPTRPHIPHGAQTIPSIQHRVHIPRTDTVDPDPMHCPLRRQTARQMAHTSLGHVVRRLRLGVVHRVAGDARDEQDGGPGRVGGAGLDHILRRGLRAQERARLIDVHHPPPVVGRRRIERRHAAHDTGKAAQDVDPAPAPAEPGDGRLDRFTDLHLIPDIYSAGEDVGGREVGLELLDRRRRALERAGQIEEREARESVLEECAGGCKGERPGAARDDAVAADGEAGEGTFGGGDGRRDGWERCCERVRGAGEGHGGDCAGCKGFTRIRLRRSRDWRQGCVTHFGEMLELQVQDLDGCRTKRNMEWPGVFNRCWERSATSTRGC
jgi:hypothetical protein